MHASASAVRTRDNQKMQQRYTVQCQLLKHTTARTGSKYSIMLNKYIQHCGGSSAANMSLKQHSKHLTEHHRTQFSSTFTSPQQY
jgi:hypothetical protein